MASQVLTQNSVGCRIDNRERREFLESQIKKKSSEIGACFKEIREFKLYKPDYDNFPYYCKSVLGFSKRHVDRLIKESEIKSNINNTEFEGLIVNESHARVLAGLNNHDLKMILANLKDLKDSGEKITANLIKEVMDCYEKAFKKSASRFSPYFMAQVKANGERIELLEESVKQIEVEVIKTLDSVNKLKNYFCNG